jgi:CSLREA domain-containing protein
MKIQKAKIILISTTAILFGLFTTIHAATFTVTRADDRNMTCNSNADCSLREAVNAANGAAGSDTITFNSMSSVQLAAALPGITTTIIINGGSGVTVSGDAANFTFRVFTVTGTGNLSLDNLTVNNGKEILGGGLYNQTGGTVSITNCSFSGNRATVTAGGAIFNDGLMTLTNTVLIVNSASGRGDGIHNGTNGNLTLTDSTVSFNGDSMKPSGTGGGGISNDGTLTVNRSTIYGNLTGGNGGGIFTLFGTVNLTNSTISFNSAFAGNGGGIYSDNGGTVTITNCTVTDGNQGLTGGGIYHGSGTIYLRNTIVAGNTGTTSAPDVFGNYNAPAFNLIGKSNGASGFTNGVNGNIVGTIAMPVDPLLAAIANNGGATQTYALMSGSPAVNTGSNALAIDPNNLPLTTDQRGAGFPRIIGGSVDIGSFESAFIPTAAVVSIGGRVLTARGDGIFRAKVSVTDTNGKVRSVYTNPSGNYHFGDVPAGETYIFTISHKQYIFVPQIIFFIEDSGDMNFVALSKIRFK